MEPNRSWPSQGLKSIFPICARESVIHRGLIARLLSRSVNRVPVRSLLYSQIVFVYIVVMANIDKHSPGDFSWIELGTTDQNAAKKFYSQLFGWAVFDAPMGPDEFYTMFSLEGRNTGAAYTLKKE